jgi:hypothetical protein
LVFRYRMGFGGGWAVDRRGVGKSVVGLGRQG